MAFTHNNKYQYVVVREYVKKNILWDSEYG